MPRRSWIALSVVALVAMSLARADISLATKPNVAGKKDSGTRKCTAAKLRAVAKKEAGLLACQATVAKTNDASGLAACESKVKSKFATAFGNAGTCPGSPAACEAFADLCESAVADAISGTFPSKCAAAKRKAAGFFASGELGCYAKAAASGGPVAGACLAKATNKFTAALGDAGACPDGGAPQTLGAAVCVDAIVTADGSGRVTDVCATGSTTSTTNSTLVSTTTTPATTTTSTTLAPMCESPNEIGCTDLTQGCFPCSGSGGACAQACQHRCEFGFADGGACASCLADLCAPACCH